MGGHLDPALPSDRVLRPGEGIAGRAFAERRPVWTGDREADAPVEYWPAADALVRSKAPRACLAVPVASGDAVHGVLACYFFLPHAFTPAEVELFHERARLREAIEACSEPAGRERLLKELGILEAKIALRLEALRVNARL